MRIRILLFSSVTNKNGNQNFFCAYYFLKVPYFSSFFKDEKSWRSHKTVGINVFLTNFAWQKDPDPELEPYPYLWLMDPDPGGPKTFGSSGSGSATLLVVYFSFFRILWHCPFSYETSKELTKGNVVKVVSLFVTQRQGWDLQCRIFFRHGWHGINVV